MSSSSSSGNFPRREQRIDEIIERIRDEALLGREWDDEAVQAQHPDLMPELAEKLHSLRNLINATRKVPPDPANEETPALPSPESPRYIPYFGDYEILDEIARGGMGIVFRALQRSLKREVALKMIRPDRLSGPADIVRFRHEAEAAAKLDHPNIVPIYEVGEHKGTHYFSMALVQGQSLSKKYSPEQPLTGKIAARYILAAADALHYAHQQGVLHRDIKPQNILIDQNDEVRITDFGLAKQLDAVSELTRTGDIVGTPQYMPPEQAAGERGRVDARSDVYSLGSTLYALITGRPAFVGENMLQIIERVQNAEPIAPRLLVPQIERDLETITLKCLEKSPLQRYASAAELRDDLQRYLGGFPIVAKPVGRAGRAWRWCRRNPAVASLSAVVTVAMLAIAAISTGYNYYLEGQNVALEKATKKADDNAITATNASTKAREESIKARQAEKGSLAESRQRFHNYYISQINFAQRDWETAQLTTFAEHLEQCRPENTGGEDFRDLEWYFLKAQSQTGKREFDLRSKVANDAATNTGTQLIVKDASSGNELIRVAYGETFLRGAFSVDRKRVATPSYLGAGGHPGDGKVTERNVETGEQTLSLDSGPGATVSYSPDGRWIATASHKCLAIWSSATGELHHDIKHNNGYSAGVSFSPDSKRLVSGTAAGISIFDVETGKWIRTFSKLATQDNITIQYSPRSNLILSEYPDHSLRIWDDETGRDVVTLLGHTERVASAAFNPSGSLIASCSFDHTVRIWDAKTGQELMKLRGHASSPMNVQFSSDGKWLASWDLSGKLILWEVDAAQSPSVVEERFGIVQKQCISPDSKLVALACMNNMIRFRQMGSSDPWQTLSGHVTYANWVTFCPHGKHLLSAGADATLIIWDIETCKPRHVLRGHSGSVWCAAFSPDGKRIISGGMDKSARIWDVETGAEVRRLEGYSEVMTAICFSPNGKLFATGGDNVIRLWDATDSREVKTLQGVSRLIHDLCFTPDGKRLISADHALGLAVWDVNTGKLVNRTSGIASRGIEVGGCLRPRISMSKSGRRILTCADGDNTLRLWDVEACQEVLRLSRPPLRFSTAGFTPDGRSIVATAYTALVTWDVSMDPSVSTVSTKPIIATNAKPPRPYAPAESWKSVSAVKGEWKVERDELVQSSREPGSLLLFGPELDEYNLSFKAKAESGTHGFKAVFHRTDEKNYCEFALGNYGNGGTDLSCYVDGNWERKEAYIPGPIEFGKWYEVRLEIRGPKMRCLIDGKEIISSVDDRFKKGRIGFSTWDSVCRFRDIVITSPEDDVLWKGAPALIR